jgi:hypothetical protein
VRQRALDLHDGLTRRRSKQRQTDGTLGSKSIRCDDRQLNDTGLLAPKVDRRAPAASGPNGSGTTRRDVGSWEAIHCIDRDTAAFDANSDERCDETVCPAIDLGSILGERRAQRVRPVNANPRDWGLGEQRHFSRGASTELLEVGPQGDRPPLDAKLDPPLEPEPEMLGQG